MDGKEIKCPRCGTKTVYSSSNTHRPFCSERCQLIDLGAWATEKYRVPTAERPSPHATDNDTPAEGSESEDEDRY